MSGVRSPQHPPRQHWCERVVGPDVAEFQRGAVVQLVRIPACHAGGRGFESRPLRHFFFTPSKPSTNRPSVPGSGTAICAALTVSEPNWKFVLVLLDCTHSPSTQVSTLCVNKPN